MKNYYSIKEVAAITGLREHVIRYWERKVSILLIERNESNRRIYTQKNVEIIKELSYLIFKRHFTIGGAEDELIRRFNAPSDSSHDVAYHMDGFSNDVIQKELLGGLQRQKQNLREVKQRLSNIHADEQGVYDYSADTNPSHSSRNEKLLSG